MSNNKSLLVLFFLVAGAVCASAQKSPYGRFGYGDLSSPVFSSSGAMGGIGYGLRDPKMINALNPASYSAVDSLSFLFDIGAYMNAAWYKDGGNRSNTFEGNIDHIGLSFRLFRGMGLSVGMVPFSSAGYSFGAQEVDLDNITKTNKYTGTGGFNRVYIGLGYNLFKNFSLGANAAYFFGKTEYKTLQTLGDGVFGNQKTQGMHVNGFLIDAGVQYTIPWYDNQLTLGVTYSPKMNLNGSFNGQEITGAAATDTTVTLGFDYPQSIGGGVTYGKGRKYLIGADVLYQQWADARFFDGDVGENWNWTRTGAIFQDRYRIALGGQYTHNAAGRNYAGRIRYRAGAHYSNSYYKIGSDAAGYAGTKEVGIGAGFGFPMLDNRSVVSISFDYTTVLPDQNNLIKEQYFKITVSYMMNEMWFVKRKLD